MREPVYIDHPSYLARPERFESVTIKIEPVIRDWAAEAVFAFEWVDNEGNPKPDPELKDKARDKKKAVNIALETGAPLKRPVLGLGIQDNIEIGAGCEVIMTLFAAGYKTADVHIPRSHHDFFAPYIVKKRDRTHESGNVLVYVLIAVALLASLAFVITQGGQGGMKDLSADRDRLLATEILDYSDSVAKAVSILRLRGVGFDQISFAHPRLSATYGTYGTETAYELFNPEGGGIIFQSPNPQSMVGGAGDYMFVADNEIFGVGTNGDGVLSNEMMLVLRDIRMEVCQQINVLLNVTPPNTVPPSDDIDTPNLFNPPGSAPSGTTTVASAASSPLHGKLAGCLMDSDDNEYVFYQVLWPR